MSQRGFSLLELLVVMAVVITISAIAVPHLLRARITANESAAVANVRMPGRAAQLLDQPS